MSEYAKKEVQDKIDRREEMKDAIRLRKLGGMSDTQLRDLLDKSDVK